MQKFVDLTKSTVLLKIVAAAVFTRLFLGILLAFFVEPFSVDDYFRVFHAIWWWEHPSFNTSYTWLPGYGYIYGTVVGLFKDTIMAPRLFTLIVHLGIATLVLKIRQLEPLAKLVAVLWILFSPLSYVVGTSPLAETLALFFLFLNVISSRNYIESGKVATLFVAALGLFAACMVRYEAWLYIPLFVLFVRKRRPSGISSAVHWMTMLLPALFPIVWALFCYASQGELLAFVFSTQRDHFGSGSLMAFLEEPLGIICVVQVLVLFGVLVYRRMGCGKAEFDIYEAYTLLSALVPVVLVVLDALPSQYEVRVFYTFTILGGITFSRWFATEVVPAGRRAMGIAGAILSIVGLLLTIVRPHGIDDNNYRAAQWIKSQYEEEKLSEDEHTLISYHLPDNTALYILSNNIEKVHLDAMGKGCSVQFLLPFEPTCPLPGWGSRVKMVVARKTGFEEEFVRSLNWKKVKEIGPWAAYIRPEGSLFPVPREKKAPGFFLR